MNLNSNNFNLLIKTISKKFKKKIVITNGNIKIDKFDQIIKNYFKKNVKNFFISNIHKNKLFFIDNTDFRDLEYIVKNSDEVICCEGAISHVSNAFDKKTFALIENINTAKFWTSHKKYNFIKRSSVSNICKQIKTI